MSPLVGETCGKLDPFNPKFTPVIPMFTPIVIVNPKTVLNLSTVLGFGHCKMGNLFGSFFNDRERRRGCAGGIGG